MGLAWTRSVDTRPRVVAGVGLITVMLLVGAFMIFMTTGAASNWSAVLLGPILVLLSLPALAHEAAREGDRRLLWFLLVALIIKLIGAIIRYNVTFGFYGGASDVIGYHEAGIRWAHHLSAGDFSTGPDSLVGTNFVELVNGIVYLVIGPSLLGSFLVFSWLGFWGLFFFYRAFRLTVPEGRPSTYARLLFLLPSMLFWPSSVGKDAWMIFTLGVASFGVASILAGRFWRGLLVAVPALWLAWMVRPHVAAMLGLSLVVAFFVRRPRKELKELAPVAYVLSLVVLLSIAFILVSRMNGWLEGSIDTEDGVVSTLGQVGERTAQGGSEFTPSIVDSPVRVPLAAVTVLFRPLIPEANSGQTLIAALEGTFLLVLSVVRFRWIVAAVKSIRRQPFVVFALSYVLVFVIMFSSISNFGILTRQRVQVLPFYLVFLAIPPMIKRVDDSESSMDAERQHRPKG